MRHHMSQNIIRTSASWIEGEAEAQLERVSQWPGMIRVVGMPDLHPGKGTPVGAAFVTDSILYPYLVGNDIGCGMSLLETDALTRKAKLDKWEKKLKSGAIEGEWDGDITAWLHDRGIESTGFEPALGTIGGGNHFAELLTIREICAPDEAAKLQLKPDHIYLLVHSGSRGFGEQILRNHIDSFKDGGLDANSDEGRAYLERHNHAVEWAKANRELIAHRVANLLGFETRALLDVVHNSVEPTVVDGGPGWNHRKGAAPSDQGIVPVPGSRGATTYLVKPKGDGARNCHSLAHGAGRKWKRSEAKDRLKKKFQARDLERSAQGSRVICEDRNLLFEEAPQAYKPIEDVIEAMVQADIALPVAELNPIMTYKVARR